MNKKVAILQSNYIPWKGYFDLIASVDEFIFYDDMQYTRRDWRNRNQIKTKDGLKWLSVPTVNKGKYHQLINETEIDRTDWQRVHWRTIEGNYKKTPFFAEVSALLQPFYTEKEYTFLSPLNQDLTKAIAAYLGITTKFSNSTDYEASGVKTQRLVELCLGAHATDYVSGPSAKDYVIEDMFRDNNIRLHWFDYQGYPEYPQAHGEFAHAVSIIDLLFNCGMNSINYLRRVAA